MVAVDRRPTDGRLFLAVKSGELDLVGNAGTRDNTIAYVALDEVTETYIWFKVFQGNIYDYASQDFAFIHATQDGSKVLATAFFFEAAQKVQKFIYLDANTGNVLGVAIMPKCCKKFYGPDAIALN